MAIKGKRMHLWGGNSSANSFSSLVGNLTDLNRDIDFIMPVADGTMFTTDKYLFNPNFVNETAQALDAWCTMWQQQTLFYDSSRFSTYEGTVDYSQYLNLFPHRIDLAQYMNSGYTHIVMYNPDDLVMFHLKIESTKFLRPFMTISGSTSVLNNCFGAVNIPMTNQAANSKRITTTIVGIRGTTIERYNTIGATPSGENNILINRGDVATSSILTTVISYLESGYTPEPEPGPGNDPYEDGGISETGGGTGTFSETGDTVGIPGLPTLSAVDTGFITLFNPSAAQVKALANYMWSASFDLATFKNIVANPIDCILGLSIVPVNPPNAGSKTVSVGNIPTDVTLPYLSSQYVEVDCGTLNVQEFWGSYLDYSPYTKMSLYLPYIGIIPLDIDDVMNASIAIKYHVDVLSGACVAYVLCNGTQLYTYVGQCSSNVPITSNDFTNTVNGILGIAGSIGKLAADGGASAPTEAAGIAANAINALKPNIQKSGAMSGTGGLMGVQTPYLICQRPRQSVPASQNAYTGYPANITARLSDLSGYTEVDSIHLDGLSATQEEQQEIMDLLTSGVII